MNLDFSIVIISRIKLTDDSCDRTMHMNLSLKSHAISHAGIQANKMAIPLSELILSLDPFVVGLAK